MFVKNTLFASVTLLLAFISSNYGKNIKASNLQRFTFYSNEDYTGESQTFTHNVPDVQGTGGVGRTAKSFCVEKGVWVIFGNMTYGPSQTPTPDFDITHGLLASSNIGMICVSLHNEETGQSALYTNIRHLASNDLDSTSLSLFNGRWKGDELFVAGDTLRLHSTISLSSFAFTGNIPWTLTVTSGDSYCLPLHNDPFLMGLNFADLQEPIEVTAAQQGCDLTSFKAVKVNTAEDRFIYPVPPPSLVKMHTFKK